jgi:tetratricopeptide (TPR) repeat protein
MQTMDDVSDPSELRASLARARDAGDAAGVAEAYHALAGRGALQEAELMDAARALIAGGAPEQLEVAAHLMDRIDPGSPEVAPARRLAADALERRGGRSPRDAAARVVAHMRAVLVSEDEARERYLVAMFRALVRVAELEGTVPRLDPSLPWSLLLEEAARAHRRWRQGGAPEDAAAAYRTAQEGDVPAVLEPYLMFWQGHLLGVAGELDEAITVYRRLLEVGPPGRNGRADVERRIEVLEERRLDGQVERLREEVAELRAEGRLREGVERLETAIHRSESSDETAELRKLLALVLTELGELELAVGEWERLEERYPEDARVALRSLRGRLRRAAASPPEPDPETEPAPEPDPDPEDAPEPEGASEPEAPRQAEEESPPEPEAAGEPEPAPESEAPKGPRGRELARVEEDDLESDGHRVRHQEDLARRLDAAGQVREAVLAYRSAYLACPPGRRQERLRKRVAAMAWHKLTDPVMATEALGGLSHAARQAPDVKRLEEDIHSGVVERFRRDVRLGLRVEAFEAVADLFRNLDVAEPLRKELFGLHLDELSSCIYRRWALRKSEVEEELQGFRSRGLAGELVRLPNEAEGSPRHLAELEEELSILESMGKALRAREWAVLRLGDTSGQSRRLEDRDGIRSMDAVLGFVREVAQRRVGHGQEKPVAKWWDRIASMFPEGARELFLSEEGRNLNLAQEDLLGQFEAFLDLKYTPRRG